jgi:hypothetical protein
VGEPQTGLNNTSRFKTFTGYYQRKFLLPNSGSDGNAGGNINVKLFRLGEIILDFAEAAAEAGKLAEATVAVNEIRTRVGMPNIPAGLNHDQLMLRIRQERRIELAMEEQRFFDLRRWCTPTGDLAKTDKWITAAQITRNSNGTYTYGRRTVRTLERLCYTNKFLWVPMPLDEANRLFALTGKNWQQPGW